MGELMTTDVITVGPDATVRDALWAIDVFDLMNADLTAGTVRAERPTVAPGFGGPMPCGTEGHLGGWTQVPADAVVTWSSWRQGSAFEVR